MKQVLFIESTQVDSFKRAIGLISPNKGGYSKPLIVEVEAPRKGREGFGWALAPGMDSLSCYKDLLNLKNLIRFDSPEGPFTPLAYGQTFRADYL